MHMYTEAGEALLDLPIKVLDKGHVVMTDYMGADRRVTDTARTSTGKLRYPSSLSIYKAEIGTADKKDTKLIGRLMNDRHTSPFEMVDFIFDCKLPIFVARQWIRHRTVSVNEQSGRYSVLPEEFYIPELNNIREQGSMANKQMSGDIMPETDANWFIESLAEHNKTGYTLYKESLERGISKEMSRLFLEVNLYTQWYWKINLHNLLHFLGLRYATDAQPEIQEYAKALLECAKAVASVSVESWERNAPPLYRGRTMQEMQQEALVM